MLLDRRRFFNLIRNFIVDDGGSIIKKSAAYHQFHAVNNEVVYIISACGIEVEFQKLCGRFPAYEEKNPFLIQGTL